MHCSLGNDIKDFLTIKDDFLVFLTTNNKLGVYNQKKKKLVKVKNLNKKNEENEVLGGSLAICNKGEYLFIHKREKKTNKAKSIEVLKFNGLKNLANIDLKIHNVNWLKCFSVYNNFEDSVILSGLTAQNKPTLFSFEFDVKEGALKELEGERRKLEVGGVEKFFRKGDMGIGGISEDEWLLLVNFGIS